MRIALKVGSTLYPLAGEEGVSEREFTSAVGFRITASIKRQRITRVRADYALEVDRGNLATTVTFTARRQFPTEMEATAFTLPHDIARPREGTLVIQPVWVSGLVSTRHLLTAVVRPPRRRPVGCSVFLDFTVIGGAIIVVSDVPAGAVLDADDSVLTDADGSVLTDP